MDSESQAALILPQVEERVTELEQAVQSFEQAVVEIERRLREVEERLKREKDLRSEFYLRPVTRAFQAGSEAAERALAANTALNKAIVQAEFAVRTSLLAEGDSPLPEGTLICGKRYRLVQLLHRRPRVHLYLAQRLSDAPLAGGSAQPLVAIREIVLTGLPPEARQRIERAAFEEFAAPQLFGSPHLPGVGDHLYIEHERHYLVMQPRPVRGSRPAVAVPLAELPSARVSNAAWFDASTQINLGIQLCHVVARLHSLKNCLGELTPAMVLVNREGGSDWAPLLLASWPPSPLFWPGDSPEETRKLFDQLFPTSEAETPAAPESATEGGSRPFAAPETFTGRRDERSDVYALGAILYLLLTGCPPAAAPQRLRAEQKQNSERGEHHTRLLSRKASQRRTPQEVHQLFTLVPPRQLNGHLSPLLEQIILRALALDPEQRFASVGDLIEALESTHLKTGVPGKPEMPTAAPAVLPQARASRLRKLLEWLKK
jgi:hypothetical protein